MDERLEEYLYNKYPEVFDHEEGFIEESCMSIGIECGDGWFGLLNELCNKLSNLDINIKFLQIKEKFGMLRIYYVSEDSENLKYADSIIQDIERRSSKICEFCGSVDGVFGQIHQRHITICDICYKYGSILYM